MPKAKNCSLPNQTFVTDPNNVQEVFATNAIVRVRDGVAHLTLLADRPAVGDITGIVGSNTVVTARIVLPECALANILRSFQAIQHSRNMSSDELTPAPPTLN